MSPGGKQRVFSSLFFRLSTKKKNKETNTYTERYRLLQVNDKLLQTEELWTGKMKAETDFEGGVGFE